MSQLLSLQNVGTLYEGGGGGGESRGVQNTHKKWEGSRVTTRVRRGGAGRCCVCAVELCKERRRGRKKTSLGCAPRVGSESFSAAAVSLSRPFLKSLRPHFPARVPPHAPPTKPRKGGPALPPFPAHRARPAHTPPPRIWPPNAVYTQRPQGASTFVASEDARVMHTPCRAAVTGGGRGTGRRPAPSALAL